jgi:alpha-glucoside transport system substrate-binding protein
MRVRRPAAALLAAGAVCTLAAGCLSESPAPGSGGANSNTSNEIEIMYGFTDTSSDQFQAELADFAKAQGITIKFSPTPDFNSLINTRVQGNQLPDIAIFPQPGVMAQIAGSGALADLGPVLPADVAENMVPGAYAAGKVDGVQYAVPMSMNVKSIVFYPKSAFESSYTAPETFDDLVALTDRIRATGTTPWCFGIESASATGWPATDWIENLVLIDQGTDGYNRWVRHDVPFNDPSVVKAADRFSQLLLTEGNVNGGRSAIAGNNFATAANPMFDPQPGCFMYRQGNFVARDGGFPDAVLADIDNKVGVFPMPGLTATDKPVLGGGDLAALFSADNEAARKVMQFMTAKQFGSVSWAAQNGFISPRTDFDVSRYPNELTRQMAQVAYDSTEFVFDGSDQMPGVVGSGSFWREMTAWISGQTDESTALSNIEASWPTS